MKSWRLSRRALAQWRAMRAWRSQRASLPMVTLRPKISRVDFSQIGIIPHRDPAVSLVLSIAFKLLEQKVKAFEAAKKPRPVLKLVKTDEGEKQ